MKNKPLKRGKIIFALLLCFICAGQAGALNYTFDAPDNYAFGRSTSVDIVYRETPSANIDRSKNTALIPPGFGTPTSYLPGSGEYLTPNLVPAALNGGLVNSIVSTGYTGASGNFANAVNYVTESTGTVVQYPDVNSFTWTYEPYDYGNDRSGYYGLSFTDVTDDLYYKNGYLGTLKIPAIGVSSRIYEGTASTQLAKGIGHFTDTSIWNGNVCLAAHNRGSNAIFGQIHTLEIGDTVTLATKLGTRNYSVVSVKKIAETDNTDTAPAWENCVTLFTCVRDQSEYRWCVRAVEIL